MKIERLIGIIAILQQKKKVTAPFLAGVFEVSRRTINRDIEDICRAGIPIVTTQGSNGGISLMEGFSLDTTVFTGQELAAVFTGLKTLDSISHAASADRIVQKFGGDPAAELSGGMRIDLSSFYKRDLTDKIERIKAAVKERRCILFHYYYEKGESDKFVEPYLVVFRWSDWYVYGFCRERQDFRMYKLRRLWELKITDEVYEVREMPEEEKRFGSHMTDAYMVTAVYDAAVKYKLAEEYGPDSFTVTENGQLYTEWGFTGPEKAEEWFLGFGDKVKVTGPPEMVDRMKTAWKNALQKYEGT